MISSPSEPAFPTGPSVELNDAQRRAVEHRDGPLMIVAGPGSGKTRVITQRIAHLVASGVPAPAILAITFTNKAAHEMLQRTLDILGVGPEDPGVPMLSTFHAFCARLLRREIYRVEPYQSDYAIYDTDDQKSVVTEVLEKLQLSKGNFPPGGVLSQISRWKNDLISPEEAAEEATTFKEESIAKMYSRYQDLLQARNALDFDDLLIVTLRLLTEHPEALERRRQFHRYILIDEFQDTNRPQYYIARLLGEAHGNLCVTGDPDQSIYSWRGASPSNFSDFQADFPNHEKVFLSENYRSTPEILAVAARLTGTGVGKRELFTKNDSGEDVIAQGVLSERDEARSLVERITTLVSTGSPLGQIAVLYRMNSLSRSPEEELIRRGVPYSIVGGVPFYNRREIKDLVCYLRATASPRDDVALRRILNTPNRGIGKVSMDRFVSAAERQGLCLGDALDDEEVLSDVGRTKKSFIALRQILEQLREIRNLSLAGQIERIVELTKYEAYLDKSDPESAEERKLNVQELMSAATEAEIRYATAARERGEKADNPLPPFLERIALMSDLDAWEDDRDKITLMTLHAAKGLEFDHVLIAGVEDSIIPHSRHLEEGNLDEERRLLYVGVTRARKTVRLYYSSWRRLYGEREPRRPSPFLDELRGDGFDMKLDVEDDYGDTPQYRSWGSRSAKQSSGSNDWTDHATDLEFDEFDSGDFGDPWDEPTEVIQPGALLEHNVLGRGVVELATGIGNSRRLTVDFEEHGRLQIVPEISAIRVISTPDAE